MLPYGSQFTGCQIPFRTQLQAALRVIQIGFQLWMKALALREIVRRGTAHVEAPRTQPLPDHALHIPEGSEQRAQEVHRQFLSAEGHTPARLIDV